MNFDLGKVFENIVQFQICTYLNDHELLNDYQSAYWRFHGTNTALLNIVCDLMQNIDDISTNALVLFDFPKAFDSINHLHLIWTS